jgi:NTE family protein
MSSENRGFNPADQALIDMLAHVPIFSRASQGELQALAANARRQRVIRGETLIRAGEDADILYIVLRGRLLVFFADNRPIAEIEPGEPAGELGFFAGLERTASVIAARNSEVLAITREDYDKVSAKLPGLSRAIMGVMAERLAKSTASALKILPSAGNTVALVTGAGGAMPTGFLNRLQAAINSAGTESGLRYVGYDDMPEQLAQDHDALSAWIAQQERDGCQLLLIGHGGADDNWNRSITENADRVFIVCDSSLAQQGPVALSDLEQRIQHKSLTPNIHKVIWRERGEQRIEGAANWLSGRELQLHHHVALDSSSDFERLLRFIQGKALGLVLCGGGAFGTAHLGAIKALGEAGIDIDIIGGTSVGAAMAAALAMGRHPDKVMDLCEEMFLKSKAMRRLTVPLHSVIDHKRFDEQMLRHYGRRHVEDLPINFFAVATSLTRNDLHLIRSGELWRAVRASSSIPALLPPVIQDDGEVLIDGALVDNVPISAMRGLKPGPNLVLNFKKREPWRVRSDYAKMPGRAEAARRTLVRRKNDQWFPSIFSVLSRTMVITSRRLIDETDMGDDVLLEMPTLPKMSFLNWKRGREQFDIAYAAVSELLQHSDSSMDPVERIRDVAQHIDDAENDTPD